MQLPEKAARWEISTGFLEPNHHGAGTARTASVPLLSTVSQMGDSSSKVLAEPAFHTLCLDSQDSIWIGDQWPMTASTQSHHSLV